MKIKTQREWFKEQGIEFEGDGKGRIVRAWVVRPQGETPVEHK